MKRFVLSAVAVVAVCAVASAQRQPGGNRPGGATSLLPQVVSNKDLQTDLKVTDAQKEKFKDPAAKLAEVTKKMADLRPAGGGRPDTAKMTEVRTEMTKVNEEVTKTVTEALTDEQKKRVKQIEVQRMGLRAFTNEAVVKELALTDDQKAKIKTISDDLAKELGTGARPGGGRPMPGATPDPEAVKKRTEANAKALEKATGELTDAQKTTWKGLTGEKFDLTKLTGFGGGRPMRNDQ